MGFSVVTRGFPLTIFTLHINQKPTVMKTLYEISSQETGTVLLRRRKIAKALRRWLRENEVAFDHRFFVA